MYFREKFTDSKANMLNKTILKQNNARGQRGMVLPLVAAGILTLIGFMALAIDVGYLFVARSELQNDADAAALTGAGYLYQANPPAPNWSFAQSKATDAIRLNKTGNVTLTDGQVSYGYWNLTGSPSGLQSSSITPGVNDKPGVKVKISKAPGNNGGPVNTFFAGVLGIDSEPVNATAVAVVTSPGYTTSLFPLAIPQCMYKTYWNNGQPQLVNGSYDIIIGSAYHYTGCGASGIAGQWTSLDLDTNNVPTIRDLISQAIGQLPGYDTTQFDIGSNIWIEPGTKTTLFGTVNSCSSAGDGTCAYVTLPVVCPNPPNCDNLLDTTHAQTPIVGFACVHIMSAAGGSAKTVTVRMVGTSDPNYSKCKTSGGGTGPNYGTYLPPRLVCPSPISPNCL
jgi:hypothetical protein